MSEDQNASISLQRDISRSELSASLPVCKCTGMIPLHRR